LTTTDLPCREENPELFFAESQEDVETAKAICRGCKARLTCLTSALERSEPWGVWGGELLQDGAIIARKRPRGRASKDLGPQTEEFLRVVIANGGADGWFSGSMRQIGPFYEELGLKAPNLQTLNKIRNTLEEAGKLEVNKQSKPFGCRPTSLPVSGTSAAAVS
jgi:WhiB family redox-sensing transcriptional regulator